MGIVDQKYYKNQTEYILNYALEHCILAVAFFLPISLDWSTVFLAGGTLLWMGKVLITRQFQFRPTPLDIPIALLVLFSAVSIWASPDKGFSFYNYYHLMGRYILLYYLVIHNLHSLEQAKKVVWAMLASAAAVALYGFYQYYFGIAVSAAVWVDGEQFPDLKMRVFSTLENPNLLAGFLVIMMAVAAGMGYRAKENGYKVVLTLLLAALGGCLLLTYSRGAWISLLAVIGVYAMLCNRKILWLLLLVPVVLFFTHDAVLERILSIVNPTDTSSTLRLALWESTIAMITDNPFLGIGWGAYWMVYPDYDFFVQNANVKIFHAHNMYLNIAAEIGIPGCLAFFAVIYGHLRLALSALKEAASGWVGGMLLGLIAAMGGILINGFTDYVLFNIQLSMTFWLLNALIIVIWTQVNRRSVSSSYLKKVINYYP